MSSAVEHQRRLAASGSAVRSFVAHPGMVTTPMNTGLTSRRDRLLAAGLGKLWGAHPAQGLRPLLYATTGPDASPEEFYGPHGPKNDALVYSAAFRAPVNDPAVGARVWEVTADIIGETVTS